MQTLQIRCCVCCSLHRYNDRRTTSPLNLLSVKCGTVITEGMLRSQSREPTLRASRARVAPKVAKDAMATLPAS